MRERIQVNPNIHFGSHVSQALESQCKMFLNWVSEGISFENIIQSYYPDLETKDIRACIRSAMEIVAAEDLHVATVVA